MFDVAERFQTIIIDPETHSEHGASAERRALNAAILAAQGAHAGVADAMMKCRALARETARTPEGAEIHKLAKALDALLATHWPLELCGLKTDKQRVEQAMQSRAFMDALQRHAAIEGGIRTIGD